MKVAIGIIVFFVLTGLGFASCAVSVHNTCVTQEAGIQAQYDQDQNNYDNFIKTVKESAQIPEMYTDDLVKVAKAAIGSRYGADGSKALFQFIKEHNPNVDSAIYTKIQQQIESGHLNFEQNQKMLLDKKRVYQTTLGTWPNSMFAGAMGFPKIDLSKFGIVTSEETAKAFATGKAPPMQLRPKPQ
jgi:hypothetical protein